MAQDQWMHRNCPGEDIISEIPDVLRLDILTRLPRKDAIRTGVLSSKWKDLWKKRFPHQTTLTFGQATKNDKQQNALATHIEEKMETYGNKKVEIFNLYFYPGSNHEKLASKWLEQAVKNGAEELNLDFSQGGLGNCPAKRINGRTKKFEMRERHFKCTKYLTILNLTFCRLQRNFRFKYFTSLETLCLRQVNINNQMLKDLLFNCRSLEVLELSHCATLTCIKVTSWQHRLKKLTISKCLNAEVVEIAAPLLNTFRCHGQCAELFVMFQDMPLLTDAILTGPVLYELDSRRNFRALFFIWLDHAQVLTLCSSILLLMFGMTHTTWVSFDELRELQLVLEMAASVDINNICKLFGRCQFSKLERLFIQLPPISTDYSYLYHQIARYFLNPPDITLPNLKILKMQNFKGNVNEMFLLDFFLARAPSLELLILVFPQEFAGDLSIHRLVILGALAKRPTASPNVQLLWLYNNQEDPTYHPVQAKALQQLSSFKPTLR